MNAKNRLFCALSAALMISGASVLFAESKPAAPKSAAPAAKATDDAKKPADADSAKPADKTGGDAPKTATGTTRKPSSRLTLPWKDLGSLSDEQKTKILAIHRTSLDEKKALEAKEHAAIMALLTDDQKKELKDVETKIAADKKMKKPAKSEDGDEEMDEKADATPAASPAAMPKKK